jgi:predicted metal-binding membrane protein
MRSRAISCSSTPRRRNAERSAARAAGMPLIVAGGGRPSRGALLCVVAGMVALAWISLWTLEKFPAGRAFHIHGISGHGAPSGWLWAGAFLTGWLLMTVAMMLPTVVPLIDVFGRMVARRVHAGALTALLLAGYLTAWLAFGVAALMGLGGVGMLRARLGWPQEWAWSAGLFLVAGAFQFSGLKYACLDRCRTPLAFIVGRWHGRNAGLEAFHIGWAHGVFCVGCCWALMSLMFAVGTLSLTWMLILAVIMTAEKNAPWGRRMARPLGIALLGIGVGIGAYNLAT